MPPTLKSARGLFGQPALFLFIVLLSIALAEVLVMLVLPYFEASVINTAVIDGILLSALILPMLWLFLYRPLKKYMAERDRALDALERGNRLLDAVNAVQTRHIEGALTDDLYQVMLEGALAISASAKGFITEVEEGPEGTPMSALRAQLDRGFAGAPPLSLNAHRRNGDPSNPHFLVARVMAAGAPVALEQSADGALLALPLHNGPRVVGVIVLAGRPGGYGGAILDMLQPYLVTCAKVIRAHAMERRNERVQEELRAARDQAEEAVKLKNKFISLVAHDLNHPLSAIILSLNYLERVKEARTGNQGKSIVRQMKVTVEEMMHMIKELLDMARLQTGALIPRRAVIDISPVVTVAIGMSIRAAYKKGVEIANDVPQGTYLFADPDLVGEVFQNLISNAIKFCHPGGRVTIFCPEGAADVIAVKDTGIGMEASVREHLFCAETKTTTPGTAGEKGTGLGIPLCMDILRAHGGTMTVESEKGRGSTFYIYIPSQASAAGGLPRGNGLGLPVA